MSDRDEKVLVEKIRDSYVAKEHKKTPVEELKALDRKVKNPGIVFAYIYGVLGSLILGTGMCFAMDVFVLNSKLWLTIGVVIGIIGIIMVSTTYPIFLRIMNNRKAKYSSEILSKSDEILNNKN